MIFTPSYGGNEIFGLAVRMQMIPNPTSQQLSAFFGINGVFSMYGGGRGRAFAVEGTLYGLDIADVNNAEGIFLSYADGIARELIDTRGRAWSSVVFRNEYQPDPIGPRPGAWSDGFDDYGGWILRYRAVFHGLI